MSNIIVILGIFDFLFNTTDVELKHNYFDNQINMSVLNIESEYEEYQDYLVKKEEEYKKKHSFNGESSDKIAKKLNKYLHSSLKGKGKFIAEYSIKKGVDPYLVTAVMLQETGCYWTCSYLTRVCNNVGGQKGKPSCNGGSYRKFDTLEEGLKFTINKLAGYYKRGLKTPEQINPHYAMTKTWAPRVQRYINKLKSA